MAVTEALKKKLSPSQRGHMPVKRTINFAVVEEKKLNIPLAAALVAVVILAAALFSKFAVADRFARVRTLELEADSIQALIDRTDEEIDAFGDLNSVYAHYTYADMTEEELDRTSRTAVMELIETLIVPVCPVQTWSLSGNQLTLDVTTDTLEAINLLSQRVTDHPLVDYCTFNIANQTWREGQEGVTTRLYIQMKPARAAEAEAAALAEAEAGTASDASAETGTVSADSAAQSGPGEGAGP